jgi:hypothetical protein
MFAEIDRRRVAALVAAQSSDRELSRTSLIPNMHPAAAETSPRPPVKEMMSCLAWHRGFSIRRVPFPSLAEPRCLGSRFAIPGQRNDWLSRAGRLAASAGLATDDNVIGFERPIQARGLSKIYLYLCSLLQHGL